MLRYFMTSIAFIASASAAHAFPVPAAETFGTGPAVVSYRIAQAGDERPPGPANLEEAVEIAQRRYGGDLVRAQTVERNQRMVHEIRLFIDDVTVRTVLVDPQTGAIIPQERDEA